MDSALSGIPFERQGAARRLLKACLINPCANHFPPAMVKAMLRFGKSELAAANWKDPGGWRSMVISYDGNPHQVADKILVGAGTMPMALRNRRRLSARLIAGLIDSAASDPAHVLCLGAGPGHIIMDAMQQAGRSSYATLVDISSEAFDYGKNLATQLGLAERVRYIQGDAREIQKFLDHPPDVVKMLGICEYLSDESIVSIAKAAADVMPAGSAIIFNSLTQAHGTDRFFRRVFGLNMIYRKPEQLEELMRQAGLGEFQATSEPLGVYSVIIGRRGGSGGTKGSR